MRPIYACLLVFVGDINLVRIGAYTNVQDGAVIHEAFEPLSSEHDGSTIVGHYCHIGANVFMRACTIEDECIIGAGSISVPLFALTVASFA